MLQLATNVSEIRLQHGRATAAELRPMFPPGADSVVLLSSSDPEVAAFSPASIELYRMYGAGDGNVRRIAVACVGVGHALLRARGASGALADVDYLLLPVTCLPRIIPDVTVTPVLASPDGATRVAIRPATIPDARVTVVVSVAPAGLVQHTLRVFFEPFIEDQAPELLFTHAGGFAPGEARVSLTAFGGNYEGVVAPDLFSVPIAGPSVIVPERALSIQPNSFKHLPLALDTPPSALTRVFATSSDPSVVAVDGPLELRDTALDVFTCTHAGRRGTAVISFRIESDGGAGETYSAFEFPAALSVNVTARGPGFILSASQLQVASGAPATLTIGPDTVPDSRTELAVSVEQSGSFVSLSPSTFVFLQGVPGQTASLTATWLAPGEALLSLAARGGVYQGTLLASQARITALAPLPGPPRNLVATRSPGRVITLAFAAPVALLAFLVLLFFLVQAALQSKQRTLAIASV